MVVATAAVTPSMDCNKARRLVVVVVIVVVVSCLLVLVAMFRAVVVQAADCLVDALTDDWNANDIAFVVKRAKRTVTNRIESIFNSCGYNQGVSAFMDSEGLFHKGLKGFSFGQAEKKPRE